MRQKAIEHFEAFGFVMNSDEKWTKDNVIVDIADSDITVYGMMQIDAPLCIVEQQPLFISHIWDLVFDSNASKSSSEQLTNSITNNAPDTVDASFAEKAKRSRRKRVDDAV